MASAGKNAMVTEDSGDCEKKIDRISDLPEEIRLRILALLPTKSAVAATVLSPRWRTLIPFPPNFKLDFDDTLILKPRKNFSQYRLSNVFKQFVRRVFRVFLRGVANISEMHLRCGEWYSDSVIGKWVRAAIRLNVRKLSINIKGRWSSFKVGSLQGSKTITCLELGGQKECFLDLIVPKDFCLPNLKELCFEWIDLSTKKFENFLKGCPQLAKLTTGGMDFEYFGTLSICCASLQYLKIGPDWLDIARGIIELDVPQLKIFVYDDNLG